MGLGQASVQLARPIVSGPRSGVKHRVKTMNLKMALDLLSISTDLFGNEFRTSPTKVANHCLKTDKAKRPEVVKGQRLYFTAAAVSCTRSIIARSPLDRCADK